MAPTTPTHLGRYQIERELGRGMMGVVYRAHDPDLGRTVALKTVAVAGALSDEQREAFEKRFIVEARAAASLSHPAIVVVHDVGRDPETATPYIALEYLEGRTLAEHLEANRRLPVTEALRIAARLAEGLHHAHARGIVHRDVKPANIMLLPDGTAKLMDFGIAKLPASQLTAAGDFFGTPSYMSPEQALNRPLDGRSDLFSLGCVLYAMLTGERAFRAESVPQILAMIAHKDPPPPSSARPELSPAVDAVVGRLLAKDLARRYPDGKTAAEDLDDVAHGHAPRHSPATHAPAVGEATATSPPVAPLSFDDDDGETADLHLEPVVPWWRRRILMASAIAVVILIASLAAVLTLHPPGGSGLDLMLTHTLKNGTVRVFVDDRLAFEESLDSKVVQKILGVEFRKGTLHKVIDVPTGEHAIRIQVQGGTFSASRRISGNFASGNSRHLQADVGGLLKRDISLVWAD
jgi:hypothetical protein